MGDTNREVILEQRRTVARQIAEVFVDYPAIFAVLVFGSVGTGQVDLYSDIDMLIICKPTFISLAQREEIKAKLGTNWQPSTENENNDLFANTDSDGLVGDTLVTLHYQTESWINSVVRDVYEQGLLATPLMPFRAYTLLGLLQNSWLVQDPFGIVERWRNETRSFPKQLKINFFRHFIPLLEENVGELVSNAKRNLGPRVFIFRLNWAVDALTGIIFSLNDTYDPADRRTEGFFLPKLENVPGNFSQRLTEILEGPFDTEGALSRALLFNELAEEVLAQVEKYLIEENNENNEIANITSKALVGIKLRNSR